MLQKLFLSLLLATLVATAGSAPQESHAADGKKKVVFVAGRPSHGYASHEHYAGCMLLARLWRPAFPVSIASWCGTDIPKTPRCSTAAMRSSSLPTAAAASGDAAPGRNRRAGGERRRDRLPALRRGSAQGEAGDKFLKWIGGYFETDWSVNPHWTAKFTTLPDHPVDARRRSRSRWMTSGTITCGFGANMEGVTPLLTRCPDRKR